MPTAKNITDIMKNRVIVFERVGIGNQAFSICCLKAYKLLIYSYFLLALSRDVTVAWESRECCDSINQL